MKSGWKAPRLEPSLKKSAAPTHEAFGLAIAARSALGDLRTLSPGGVDVERAAISVAGKLLGLEMVSLTPDLMPPTPPRDAKMPQRPRDSIAIISLPLPSLSSKISDPTLILLIATYLSHILIALSHYFSSASPKHAHYENLVLYSQTLHDSPSLLRWVSLCTQLPEKQCDVLLTRAYTALTSISSQASGTAEALFRIRTYAFMCLLHTSGSTIGPKTFWDQVVRSASSFAKSASSKDKEEERRLCRVVTSAFSELLALVEERENKKEFLHGTHFISFCDAWVSYSKTVSNFQYVSEHHSISPGRRCQWIEQGHSTRPIIAFDTLHGS
ncbi:hypothetical protein F5148DRAFT_978931 [Russula earlei]|uniref:Uncharacterized protein n=1 Tax=Russula earlei TaxID=71964 RepID=A0ACC0UBD0_9AGAM|nr:hypothetical protein F5148DRAFT_978931 [Russula earlei]